MFCLLREWAWPTLFLGTMTEFDREAVGRIIERVAVREGLEVVHWETVGPRNNFVLRIYVDKPGGISHSDCEAVSKQVGTLLDVEDLIANRYVLEVSSPGIERGLYKRADFERFAGSQIRLRTSVPIDGQRNFRGRLIGLVGDRVCLEAEGRGQIEVPYENVVKANVEYQF
jgi:ribosome maturation factor RimP